MKYDPIDINKLREENPGRTQKQPFQHQFDAFKALNEIFTFKDNQPKSTLLVLPTGAGKTFTTVKWLYDQSISRNIKILWLAHSFHLLDQAHETFHENAQWAAEPRQKVNIRIVSSHKSHDNVSSIQLTDDIVIMTTQTAIGALDSKATSRTGAKMVSNLRKFIVSCRTNRLIIVLDEAHHAPAYGCRNLLLDIRNLIPNRYLIGLTATPTYTDVSKRGWLGKIFEHGKYNGKQGIAYEVGQAELIASGILARPKFIEKPTGIEREVDDKLYNRLVREHKELPEDIIGKLAAEAKRNDIIVDDYLRNRELYGKTIIFADRWFQCEYLKEKLVDRGVSADNVYSHIDEDPGSADARNKRTSDDNKRIIEEFKHGIDGAGNDKLDVLINVRMLNEGMDVPTVKTVFITRQTTSSILITQMMGRALRGREAGGGKNKSEANIVLFIDEWKQLINWATPNLSGGTEESKPEVRGFYPYESISIQLVQNLIKQINSGEVIEQKPYIEILPDGWYQTNISFNASGTDVNDQSFTEFTMVWEHNKLKFKKFIDEIANNLSDEWSKEYLQDEWMMSEASIWVDKYFDKENDDIGNNLNLDLIKLARHLAQNSTKPIYHHFHERENHDLDKLAKELLLKNAYEQRDILQNEFNKQNSLWKTFYKTYDRFKTAYDAAENRILNIHEEKRTPPTSVEISPIVDSRSSTNREPTDEDKNFIKERDSTCLACGIGKGQGVKLQIDHILPFRYGGDSSLNNLQMLCSICNRKKGDNEIDFRIHSTSLSSPLDIDLLLRNGEEDTERSLRRMINFFYKCQAVNQISKDKRRSINKNSTLKIELYPGNEPEWLLRRKTELIEHIQTEFKRFRPSLKDIIVVTNGRY